MKIASYAKGKIKTDTGSFHGTPCRIYISQKAKHWGKHFKVNLIWIQLMTRYIVHFPVHLPSLFYLVLKPSKCAEWVRQANLHSSLPTFLAIPWCCSTFTNYSLLVQNANGSAFKYGNKRKEFPCESFSLLRVKGPTTWMGQQIDQLAKAIWVWLGRRLMFYITKRHHVLLDINAVPTYMFGNGSFREAQKLVGGEETEGNLSEGGGDLLRVQQKVCRVQYL